MSWGGLILAVLITILTTVFGFLFVIALPFLRYALKTKNKKMFIIVIVIFLVVFVLIIANIFTKIP